MVSNVFVREANKAQKKAKIPNSKNTHGTGIAIASPEQSKAPKGIVAVWKAPDTALIRDKYSFGIEAIICELMGTIKTPTARPIMV